MPGWLTGTMPGYAGMTGNERIEIDTQLSGGASPQSAFVNPGQLAPALLPRNLIDGGDFTVNPFQRGTSFTGISNTLTYTADRFFAVGGPSSSISVSQQAIASGALPGFGQALQFGRASGNSDTTAIKLGQVIESRDSIRCQGRNLCLSFWAQAGANFSPAGGTITATIYGGTGTDQSAANMVAGTWTGQTALFSGPVQIQNTVWGSRIVVNNGGAGIAVPNTITQLGLLFSLVPSGTAGANDWVQFAGIQLETGTNPSVFEYLDVQVALEIAQRYFYQLNEPAAGAQVCMGVPTGTNTQGYVLPLPVQMRAVPAVSVSAGSFKVVVDGASAAAATGLTNDTSHNPNAASLKSTVTLSAAAHSIILQGGGGTGFITASADL